MIDVHAKLAPATIAVIHSLQNYEFINNPPTILICPISKQIMLNPQKTQCCKKHIAMETIQDYQKNQQPCPFCSSKAIETTDDPILQKRTRAVKIFCPYKQEGCHWEGEIRHVSAHLHGKENHCPHSLAECPYSCGTSIQAHCTEKHLQHCTVFNAPLKCQHCGQEYPRDTPHMDSCPRMPVPCGYQCGQVMERGEFRAHLKVCPKLQTKHAEEEADYTQSEPEDENFLLGDKLLGIAKKMLALRSKLPDIRISLTETIIELELNSSGREVKEDAGDDDSLLREAEPKEDDDSLLREAELRQYKMELQQQEEQIETQLQTLREELHQTHKEITHSRHTESSY